MAERGSVNAYTCQACGRTIVTVDRDVGVTPAMLACGYVREVLDGEPRGRAACGGHMMSHWYRSLPGDEPGYEWYRPTLQEAREVDRRAPGSLRHVQDGGLFIRKREEA